MQQQRIVYDDTTDTALHHRLDRVRRRGHAGGLLVAAQLAWWQLNFGVPYLTFWRLRPLHTNAVIFAFVGNMMFAGIYYSTQRLLKARMASRPALQDPLLGLAGHHRRGGHHAAARHHHLQGVRRAGVAHRHRHRAGLGGLRHQLLLDAGEAQREEPLRRHLVLHRHHRHRGGAAHRQQPGAAAQPAEELLDLRRRAGRAGAVVVRPQRRRLLPDHAHPGHHVLLPAQGGGAARSTRTGSPSSTSGRWSSSTSGPVRTTCSTPRCRTGRSRWAWCSA